MRVRNRFCYDNDLTNKKRDKTQIKGKIILFIEFELVKEILQSIIGSQSRIIDFFIQFKKFTEEKSSYQRHRSHQNFDVELETERYREKPDYYQDDWQENNS